MNQENDYELSKKIKIQFRGMPYNVMPRYKTHYLDNEYEYFSLQLLINDLDSNMVFLDIGAHYGAYSLCAAHFSNCKVIAVEPVNENFQLLNENININNMQNQIQSYKYAVSDSVGKASFNIPWASDSAGFYEHPNAKTIKTQDVEVVTVDSLIKSGRVDFIKIDTEGNEIKVLEGLSNTLKNNPDAKLIIELNPECLKRADSSPEELFEKIKHLDKEIFIIDDNEFKLVRITEITERWADFVPPSGYANLYCIPKINAPAYLLWVSHSSRLDGAERALVDQVTALRREGVMSHVVLPSAGPLRELLIDKGIGNTIVDDYTFWVDRTKDDGGDYAVRRIDYSNINAAVEIKNIASTIRPSAVVNNCIVNPWGYVAARVLGLPLFWLVNEYGDIDHDIIFSHGIKNTQKFIIRESDLVLCCSKAVEKVLVDGASIPHNNVFTSYYIMQPNNIIKKSMSIVKSPFNKLSTTIKLCIVGVVKEKKGQHLVIGAVAKLKEQGIKVDLLIIGDGSPGYTKKLKKLSKELGVEDSIKFMGIIDNPYPYIKQSDAVIVASHNEAFGRVAAESMAIGTLVIGSDVGGTSELIEYGKSGLLFKSDDENSLIEQIKKIPNIDITKITQSANKDILKLLDSKKNIKSLISLMNNAISYTDQRDYGKLMNAEWVNAFSEAILENQTYFKKIKETDKKLAEFQEHINQLEAANTELVRINDASSKSINLITNSTIWKITSPLRKTKHIIRKFKG